MLIARSPHPYAETVARLLAAIDQRRLTVFARVDHAAGARAVGLALADEEVIVFGNPRAGTGLMQVDPRVGIELPLRVLVWGGPGEVCVGYDDPRELAARYELEPERTALEAMAQLLAGLTAEATT